LPFMRDLLPQSPPQASPMELILVPLTIPYMLESYYELNYSSNQGW
jgi:hypothetical protein